MGEFQDKADLFILSEKWVAGIPSFNRTQMNDGWDLIWLIEDSTGVTKNRVHIKTFDGSPSSFIVMTQLWWEPKEKVIPIFRLMMVPPKDPHINIPPLPPGIHNLSVIGPRYYTWEQNREAFRPNMAGLPFAIPLLRNLEDFHNAIRYVCGECQIGLADAMLPDFPGKGSLL